MQYKIDTVHWSHTKTQGYLKIYIYKKKKKSLQVHHSSDTLGFIITENTVFRKASEQIHPCRCLCLGWLLQNTNSRPRRRTKKQSLQRFFRAVLVFMPIEGCRATNCWFCPSNGARKGLCWAWNLPLAWTIAAVMVEMQRRAPVAGRQATDAYRTAQDSCRVSDPSRDGSNVGAMAPPPVQRRQHP